MEYILHIVVVVGIYGVLSLSQNLILGRGGMLLVAQGGLFAVGAYTAGICMRGGLNPWVSIVGAVMLSVAFGCPMGVPALRLKGDYLLVASLGLCEIIRAVLNNWESVTGGAAGLLNIPVLSIGGVRLQSPQQFAPVAMGLLGIYAALLVLIDKSPFGRLLSAVGEDDDLARSLGKEVRKVRVATIAFTSAWTGVAGAVWACYLGYLDPSGFTPWESVYILSIVIVGGMDTSRNILLSTCVLVALPEILRFVGLPSSVSGPLRQVIYGFLLVAIMRAAPRRLESFGVLDKAQR